VASAASTVFVMPTTAPTRPTEGVVLRLDDFRVQRSVPVVAAPEETPAQPADIVTTVARAVAGTWAGQALTGAAAVPGAVAAGLRMLRG
jgi:hypothetical protein